VDDAADFRALFNDICIDPFSTFFAFLFIGIAVVSVPWHGTISSARISTRASITLILLSTFGMISWRRRTT
jgi:hypothetical protein